MEKEMKEIELEKSGNFSTLLKGILIGGVIGAGIALLSAPRAGMETREMLREKGMDLKDKAAARADEARSRAASLAQVGADRASEIKERGQQVLNEQKATLTGVVEGVKEGIRTYKEQGQTSPQEQFSQTEGDLPAPLPPQSLMVPPEESPGSIEEMENRPDQPESGPAGTGSTTY